MAEVQDVDPRNQYTATVGQTEFDFKFLVYSDSAGQGSYLKVIRTRAGVSVTLDEGTDYTVDGLDTTGGGTITLTSGAEADDIYTLYRDLPIKTYFTFATAGDFFATDVNTDQNLWLQIVQQLRMYQRRTLYAPIEAELDSLSLPSPSALRLLRWNSTGDAIENGPKVSEITGGGAGDVVGISRIFLGGASKSSAANGTGDLEFGEPSVNQGYTFSGANNQFLTFPETGVYEFSIRYNGLSSGAGLTNANIPATTARLDLTLKQDTTTVSATRSAFMFWNAQSDGATDNPTVEGLNDHFFLNVADVTDPFHIEYVQDFCTSPQSIHTGVYIKRIGNLV